MLLPYVINKRNLHHCKRYSVHYTSTYSMLSCHARSLHNLAQGSSTFFSSRTPWLRETLSRDPHPRRQKFGPDIHIIYLELSVSHTHTLPYTCLNRITNHL